ncbi:hypothetical protein MASSI9I_50770 [Massilia sp. 9I]|nr:hypothetical protein MASSI9I_50770 [Massilia sp. 9I]
MHAPHWRSCACQALPSNKISSLHSPAASLGAHADCYTACRATRARPERARSPPQRPASRRAWTRSPDRPRCRWSLQACWPIRWRRLRRCGGTEALAASDERPVEDALEVQHGARADVAEGEGKGQQAPDIAHDGQPDTAHRAGGHQHHQPQLDAEEESGCFVPDALQQRDGFTEIFDVVAHGGLPKLAMKEMKVGCKNDNRRQKPAIVRVMLQCSITRIFA